VLPDSFVSNEDDEELHMSIVMAVNTGSSSIRFALYRMDQGEIPLYTGALTSIASKDAMFSVIDSDGHALIREAVCVADHGAACEHVFGWLHDSNTLRPDAVGHRIVHGGPLYSSPQVVSPALVESLHGLVVFAPQHLPQALQALDHASRLFPGSTQVACFDTAFHRSMPDVARLYALPEEVRRHGVQRYGFHGLSYQYLMSELERTVGTEIARGRLVLAHLGHGASMAAVKEGRSIDTTMGFSPAGGLVMSTRSGDLDPGVLLFLLEQEHMDAAAITTMINSGSGMLGLSGISGDMQMLLDAVGDSHRARQAVDLFCYQAKKTIGAFAAAMGGLDSVIFTGGIGEHSAVIRQRLCSGLGFLGIELDDGRNHHHEPVISGEASRVDIRVMATNEELMIARLVAAELSAHE